MAALETNIYPITNLGELSTRYRLVEIAGLRPEQLEYFQNRQALALRLTYALRKPALVIEREGVPYLVVPEDVTVVPTEVPLVRTVVQLRPRDESIEVDYSGRHGGDAAIALRFLGFFIQAPLRADSRLWQPGAGRPFFQRIPQRTQGGIHRYAGFSVRSVLMPEQSIGLCVDVTGCYVGAQPLPTKLTRDEFSAAWKGRHCIYRFGNAWYEIRLHGLADRNAKEFRFIKDGKTWSLLDYLLDRVSRPVSSDLGNLADDAAVVLYQDNRNNELGAPAALCYPVFHTSSDEVARQHGRAILPPQERREATRSVVGEHLRELRFGNTVLRTSHEPFRITRKVFAVPDLRFGNGVVLSTRGTNGAVAVNMSELGGQKLSLLRDRLAGFYESAPLDRQYLVLPRSVYDTFGDQFIKDLCHTVDEFFPQPGGYAPVVVSYDDRGRRTFVHQARALREAVEAQCTQPGYALVMVHRTSRRGDRDEDQLVAMVVRELRKRCDVRGAVIHSEVPRRAYRERRGSDGRVRYECGPDDRRKLAGYLRNVAITKVLLTNQRWPFVLATPLHADVTVGIDVKNNTAGLLVIGNHGGDIRSELKESRQKERLLSAQTATYVEDILRREAETRGSALSTIIVHRDGRTFPSEIDGFREALRRLKAQGHVAPDVRYAILEISKSSPAPLRIYDVQQRDRGFSEARNPLVGTVYLPGDREAYICSTGGPFLRQGTAHPLHVVMTDGTVPFIECLEDLYSLTALTWTQPDGCTRYPITIKLNDRILAAEAGEYDVDALEFAKPEMLLGGPTSEEVA